VIREYIKKQEPGSDESVALIRHPQVAQQNKGRVSDPNSRFERPNS
jgi:hypothetical protein